jgi:hypothetical protein
MAESESEEKWTQACEQNWYVGYVTRHDPYYFMGKLEGTDDPRYKFYCHRSVVADGFGKGTIGTKLRVRLRPNRRKDSAPWEVLEAVIEKDLAAQNAATEKQ